MNADVADSPEEFALPAQVREEVENRLAEHDKDPSGTLNREELWQRVDELDCDQLRDSP